MNIKNKSTVAHMDQRHIPVALLRFAVVSDQLIFISSDKPMCIIYYKKRVYNSCNSFCQVSESSQDGQWGRTRTLWQPCYRPLCPKKSDKKKYICMAGHGYDITITRTKVRWNIHSNLKKIKIKLQSSKAHGQGKAASTTVVLFCWTSHISVLPKGPSGPPVGVTIT